jgi:cystathionine beta-lyase
VAQVDLERYGLRALQDRRTAKWATHPPGVLAAWVADMDFPVAPPVHEALEALLATDQTGYPSSTMVEAVREAFVARMASRYRWAVDPATVELTSEVVQGIALCLWQLTEPGDAVLVPTPAYPPFLSVVRATGRRLVELPLTGAGGRVELDGERLAATVRAEGVRVVLWCSPHNPTGRVWRPEELAILADVALAEDLVVVSDEIHAELVYPGHEHRPFATLGPEVAARTVTLTSASKAFNLAGLRCAVAVLGSPALQARWRALPEALRGGLSSPGLVATAAAWRDGDPWLAEVLAYLETNRDLVVATLQEAVPAARHVPPEGTYLAWIDLSATGLGPDPAAWLLEHARLALSSGPEFGPPGAGHVRLNFATPRPVLVALLERLVEALATRPPRGGAQPPAGATPASWS